MPQKTQKKENLPVKVDVDLQNGGTISYANEVIATIAGVAANEIDGIAGMCVSGGFSEILGRNKNITRGVKVEVGSQEAAVDLYVIVEYGKPIQKLAAEVQENVRKAIESMTGLHVVKVDVHVQGVSFEKENKERDAAIEATKAPALEAAEAPKKKSAKKKKDEPAEPAAPAEKPAEEAAPADAEPAAEAPAEPAAEAPAAEPTEAAAPETAAPEEAVPEEPAAPEAETAEPAAAEEAEAPEADGETKKPHQRKPRRRA